MSPPPVPPAPHAPYGPRGHVVSNTCKNKFRPSLLGSSCHGRWISLSHISSHVYPSGSLPKWEFSSFCSLRGQAVKKHTPPQRELGAEGFKKIVHLCNLPGFCGDSLLPCDLTVMGVNTPDFTPLHYSRDLNTADVKSAER